jgi:hypothetical protein
MMSPHPSPAGHGDAAAVAARGLPRGSRSPMSRRPSRLFLFSSVGAMMTVIGAPPRANGEGGERAIQTPHEDKQLRLVHHDESDDMHPWSLHRRDGGDGRRGRGLDCHGGSALLRAIGDGHLPCVKVIRHVCLGSTGIDDFALHLGRMVHEQWQATLKVK